MKRIFDFLLSLCALFLLTPLMVIIAFNIRKDIGSPVFFRQTRPGLNGKPFQMIKFRTMKNIYDEHGNELSVSERLTPFGKKLRNTSLDEIPELWNVLLGEMSLVGPRPLLLEYLPLYSKEQLKRHDVLPGITGWAQINGRNAISWEEKFKLDLWYVNNNNFLVDVKILILTVKKVMFKDDINHNEQVTMPKFKGTHNE